MILFKICILFTVHNYHCDLELGEHYACERTYYSNPSYAYQRAANIHGWLNQCSRVTKTTVTSFDGVE